MVTPPVEETKPVPMDVRAMRQVLRHELVRGKPNPKVCDSRCGMVSIPLDVWRVLMSMFTNLEEVAALLPTGSSEPGRNGKR